MNAKGTSDAFLGGGGEISGQGCLLRIEGDILLRKDWSGR